MNWVFFLILRCVAIPKRCAGIMVKFLYASPPSAAYMCQWIGPALVQIMTIHYLNHCWFIINWTLVNKLHWNFNNRTKLFIHKKCIQKYRLRNGGYFVKGGGGSRLLTLSCWSLVTHWGDLSHCKDIAWWRHDMEKFPHCWLFAKGVASLDCRTKGKWSRF